MRRLLMAITAAYALAGCAIACNVAHAATPTNVQTIAGFGGRIVGAARACNVDGARLRTTTEKLFAVINARSESESEIAQATGLFASTLNRGATEVANGVPCSDAIRAYESIERRFAACKPPYTKRC